MNSFDPDNNNPPEPDEFDICHHGVGFDEECEACDLEIEASGLDDPDDLTIRESGYC